MTTGTMQNQQSLPSALAMEVSCKYQLNKEIELLCKGTDVILILPDNLASERSSIRLHIQIALTC
jgi:hypothetical protein